MKYITPLLESASRTHNLVLVAVALVFCRAAWHDAVATVSAVGPWLAALFLGARAADTSNTWANRTNGGGAVAAVPAAPPAPAPGAGGPP